MAVNGLGDRALGLLEALGTVGSSALAEVPRGYGNIVGLLTTGDLDEAIAYGDQVASNMTYKPTERSEPYLEALSGFIDNAMRSEGVLTGVSPMDLYREAQSAITSQDPAVAGALGAGLEGLLAMGLPASKAGRVIKGIDGDKLSLNYPDVGAPIDKIDKKTGKEFRSKGLSDEEKLVQKERNRIAKEMDEAGYEPMFPVEERYYADPSFYQLEGNTRVDTLPKKQETIDKKIAQFDTPEARAALNAAYDAGLGPLSQDWYAMGQLQDAFIKELGPEEGAKAFKGRFADAMAATTGGADPKANLLMAAYGNFLRKQGLSPPSAAYEMPHPIGGRYVTGNMAMYDKVLNQEAGLTTAGQPKRFNFSANFLGDRSRATIDEQMSQGMAGINAPPQGAYGVMEGIVADEAAKRGIQPANFQDVAWAGFKNYEGKPMITEVNEMIERTSRLTGKTPEEVLRGFIRGNMPMYGILGATTAGMLAGGDDDGSM